MKSVLKLLPAVFSGVLLMNTLPAFATCDTQATVSAHVNAGRATQENCGFFQQCYYAVGSDYFLGKNSASSVVLLETSPNYFEISGSTGTYTNDNNAIVSVPSDYDYCNSAQEYPVIISLHGWLGNPSDQLERMPFDEHTNNLDFMAITPPVPGFGLFNAWNSRPTSEVEAQIQWMIDRYRIDEDRIYIAGHSAGGRGAYKFSIQEPGRAAAILVSAGDDSEVVGQTPTIPTAVIAIHGTADVAVSYASGVATAQRFATAQHCSTPTTVTNTYTITTSKSVDTQSWTQCDAAMDVTIHHVNDADHNESCFTSNFWNDTLNQLFNYSR